MDPQANAQAQVSVAREILEAEEQGMETDFGGVLAELVLALAAWRARGGAEPDWKRALGE